MHGHYGPPTGSRPPRVEWSHDRLRHVIPKRHGHDPVIFVAMAMKFGENGL